MKETTHDAQADDMITAMYNTDHPYHELANVLVGAYKQAAEGKGKERHASGQSFTEQPMQTICRMLDSGDGMAYQIIKKVQESQRLDRYAAINELRGAINYAAGLILYHEREIGEDAEEIVAGEPCKDLPRSMYGALLEARDLMRQMGAKPVEIRMNRGTYNALCTELGMTKLDRVDTMKIIVEG